MAGRAGAVVAVEIADGIVRDNLPLERVAKEPRQDVQDRGDGAGGESLAAQTIDEALHVLDGELVDAAFSESVENVVSEPLAVKVDGAPRVAAALVADAKWQVRAISLLRTRFAEGTAQACALGITRSDGRPTDAHQWCVDVTLVPES